MRAAIALMSAAFVIIGCNDLAEDRKSTEKVVSDLVVRLEKEFAEPDKSIGPTIWLDNQSTRFVRLSPTLGANPKRVQFGPWLGLGVYDPKARSGTSHRVGTVDFGSSTWRGEAARAGFVEFGYYVVQDGPSGTGPYGTQLCSFVFTQSELDRAQKQKLNVEVTFQEDHYQISFDGSKSSYPYDLPINFNSVVPAEK